MDEVQHAIIESERYWDDRYGDATAAELAPVSSLDDGAGGVIKVYADGSYCVTLDGKLV